MKLIFAIIRPEQLAAVQAALTAEACLMAVSQVLGDGREPGCTGMYRGVEFRVRRPKLRLEIAGTIGSSKSPLRPSSTPLPQVTQGGLVTARSSSYTWMSALHL